jgi:hypothetical protein
MNQHLAPVLEFALPPAGQIPKSAGSRTKAVPRVKVMAIVRRAPMLEVPG